MSTNNPFDDALEESGHSSNPFQSGLPQNPGPQTPAPVWIAPAAARPQPQPQYHPAGGYGQFQPIPNQQTPVSKSSYPPQQPTTPAYVAAPAPVPVYAAPTKPLISPEQFESLKAQNHQLSEDYKHLEAKNRSLESTIESLRAEVEKGNKIQAGRDEEFDRQEDTIKQQQKEIANLKKRVATLEGRIFLS